MVVKRRIKTGSGLGSGPGSQDRPALTKDRVRDIIFEEVVETADVAASAAVTAAGAGVG